LWRCRLPTSRLCRSPTPRPSSSCRPSRRPCPRRVARRNPTHTRWRAGFGLGDDHPHCALPRAALSLQGRRSSATATAARLFFRRSGSRAVTAGSGVKRLRAGRPIAGVGAGAAAPTLHRQRADSARLRWALKRRPAQVRIGRLSRSHSSGHRSPSGRVLCHARTSGRWLLLTRGAIVYPRAGVWRGSTRTAINVTITATCGLPIVTTGS